MSAVASIIDEYKSLGMSMVEALEIIDLLWRDDFGNCRLCGGIASHTEGCRIRNLQKKVRWT